MNAFYAGVLLTLVLNVRTLRIDLSSISVFRASVRPIRLQLIFLSTWFKVEGQVVGEELECCSISHFGWPLRCPTNTSNIFYYYNYTIIITM